MYFTKLLGYFLFRTHGMIGAAAPTKKKNTRATKHRFKYPYQVLILCTYNYRRIGIKFIRENEIVILTSKFALWRTVDQGR